MQVSSKFRNIITYSDPLGEENSGDIMTVPDQSLTLKQILERHVRGLPITGVTEPVYTDDEYPDPRTLDITELSELTKFNQDRLRALMQPEQDAQGGAEALPDAPAGEQGGGSAADDNAAEQGADAANL